MILDSRSPYPIDHERLARINRGIAANREIWREVRRNVFEHGRQEEPGEVIGWDPLTGEILAQLGVPVHRKVLPGGFVSGKSSILGGDVRISIGDTEIQPLHTVGSSRRG